MKIFLQKKWKYNQDTLTIIYNISLKCTCTCKVQPSNKIPTGDIKW